MKKYLFIILFSFFSFDCASITPVLNDVCNISGQICVIANNACIEVPPDITGFCDIAGDVCIYSNNICQMLPGKNLTDNTTKNVLNELRDIKNSLDKTSYKSLSKNDILALWQTNKIRLFELQNLLR